MTCSFRDKSQQVMGKSGQLTRNKSGNGELIKGQFIQGQFKLRIICKGSINLHGTIGSGMIDTGAI